MEKDQEFVDYVARALVNNSDAVKTERTVDEMGVLITLYVDKDDMGYIIGRSGQTARAFRTLLRIVGAKNNARVNLKIYEPDDERRARQEERQAQQRAEESNQADDSMDDDIDTSAVDDLKI